MRQASRAAVSALTPNASRKRGQQFVPPVDALGDFQPRRFQRDRAAAVHRDIPGLAQVFLATLTLGLEKPSSLAMSIEWTSP